MTYTNVAKPGAQTYSNLNPLGKEQYDQSTLTYDDSGTFYDGVNPSAYTNVARPTGGYGDYTWAQMAFSWSEATGDWSGGGYTKVSKPT